MLSNPLRSSLLVVSVMACSSTESKDGTPPKSEPSPNDASVVVDAGTADADTGAAPLQVPFHEGPYGTTPRSIAGPFTLPTTDGPWSFRDAWTGDDHYVFLAYAPGALVFQSGTDFSVALFKGQIAKLLSASPRNVHYFFLWQKDEPGFSGFRTRAQTALAALPPADRDHWTKRVHFVTTQADKLEGWVGDLVRTRISEQLPYKRFDPLQWAIDRTQHVREVGMLGRLAQGGITADLAFLASEPTYYEFEHQREAKLRAGSATVVEVFKDKTVIDEIFAEAVLPDAAKMADFDSLHVDLTMNCEHHRDGECGAWDYLSHLHLCEEIPAPLDAGAPEAGADAGPAAPSLKCDTEIARWITPYWREGRWVTDISQMLPLLQRGGRHHLRWYASRQWDPRPASYVASLALRFSNQARGMRPTEVKKLFEGGALNDAYNAKYSPFRVTVPAGVKKVEVYALVTGHGSETEQCAEFCNHTHHFSANGVEHSIAFPEAQTLDGCRSRVGEGVVPNQHGTWYFGRGGWCPGLDVRPSVLDVTSDLKPGVEGELTYRALVGTSAPATGQPYGNIVLTSYLVYWR